MLLNKYLKLSNDFDFFFLEKKSLIYIKGKVGIVMLKLPSFYFLIYIKGKISFLFINYFFFKSVLKHFLHFYNRLFFFHFVKIRVKGLGYRIKRINKFLYRFFFNSTNFFYFYLPLQVLVRLKRRRLILLSNDLSILKKILAALLLLKKISVYRVRGILYPRKIIFLKIGKKNL